MAFLPSITHVKAEIVGMESYNVCFHGVQDAESFQLYFGQAYTGKKVVKDTAVLLNSNSRCENLKLLKPDTEYIWNVKAKRGGKWEWAYGSDKTFRTGGVSTNDTSLRLSSSAGNSVVTGDFAQSTASWQPVSGAVDYKIYYGPKENPMAHGVKVSDRGLSLSIGGLKAKETYYYRVAALVGNKEVWSPTQVLYQPKTSTTPVLGTHTYRTPKPVSQVPTMKMNKKAPVAQEVNEYEARRQTAYSPSRAPQGIGGMYYGQVAGVTNSMNTTVKKANSGRAMWTNTAGAVKSFQIFYWSDSGEKFGVTINDSQASAKSRELTIQALNPEKSYTYRVQAITVGGKAVWLTDVKPLN